jgi:hypothetical protein
LPICTGSKSYSCLPTCAIEINNSFNNNLIPN